MCEAGSFRKWKLIKVMFLGVSTKFLIEWAYSSQNKSTIDPIVSFGFWPFSMDLSIGFWAEGGSKLKHRLLLFTKPHHLMSWPGSPLLKNSIFRKIFNLIIKSYHDCLFVCQLPKSRFPECVRSFLCSFVPLLVCFVCAIYNVDMTLII